MSAYLKAVVAAILTGVGALATTLQVVFSDGEVTSEEAGIIVTAVLVFVTTVYGVYKAKNTPVPPV